MESSFDWMCEQHLPPAPEGKACRRCGAEPAWVIGGHWVSAAGEWIPSLYCSKACVVHREPGWDRGSTVLGWWDSAQQRWVSSSPPTWIEPASARRRAIAKREREAGI